LPELTRDELVDIVRRHHPSTLAAVKESLSEEGINISDEELLPLIRKLQYDGTINLSLKVAASFKEYLFDIWSTWWFYLAIIVAMSELTIVISNATVGAILFLRIVFGLGMLGIIPGFLTVLIVFPGGQINTLEKIALSIFLSVLISITVGVALGLGPFFQPSNNIIILTAYVILADFAAGYRSYDFLRKTG
jgi:uncharacterized membrane protein